MSARPLLGVALADFRERSRRPAFLVTIAATLWLARLVVTGTVRMQLGTWQGVKNSAWIGALMALVASTLVSLIGYYVVRGSVERDRVTGVGQILAATPLTRVAYLLGKALSSFLVLGAVALVLASAGVAMQLLAGADRRLDLWNLFVPTLVVALPALAVTAALAVLFECLPFVRGGFGNVAWIFLWTVIFGVPLAKRSTAGDILGLTAIEQQLSARIHALDPSFVDAFSLTAGPVPLAEATKTFVFEGLALTPAFLLQRLACLGVALLLVALAAAFFDRFDAAPRAARTRPPKAALPAATVALAPAARHLTPLAHPGGRARFLGLYRAELLLLVKGRGRWWILGAAGLLVAGLASPLADARHQVLAFTWLWPVLLWSPLGNREAKTGTAPFLFAVPRPVGPPLFAAWLAGATVALATGAGVGLRLLAGEPARLLGFFAGALFVPALALACGAWSGTSKLFEGLYTALWYIGPAQGKPEAALDFLSASPDAVARGTGAWVLAAAMLLFALALAGRRRQLAAL
jgi:hypothetical protein